MNHILKSVGIAVALVLVFGISVVSAAPANGVPFEQLWEALGLLEERVEALEEGGEDPEGPSGLGELYTKVSGVIELPPTSERPGGLQAGHGLFGVRLSQVPRRRVRSSGLPDRVAPTVLRLGVLRGTLQQPTHGLLLSRRPGS